MNQIDAYADAYSRKITDKSENSIKVSSSRLMTRVDVKVRIAELQRTTSEEHGITVASIIEELEEARRLGAKVGNPSAMVNAIKEKARMAGVQPAEKHDVNVNGGIAFTINPIARKK